MADIDEKERQRQDISDIRYLRLLRAMIHNEIMFVDPDAREEGQDPALFRKYVVFTSEVFNIMHHQNYDHSYLQTI